jgi:anti-sigma regulatory factor (Ser/Thr protein kinase)
MKAMAPHQVFEVHEPSQVGEARRGAVLMAERLGFNEESSGRLALVVTELGTNLARHAVGGQLLVARHTGPAGEAIEVLSLDRGPGMADVHACLKDGYSTSSTPGNGFGAVRRLADDFAVFSAVPAGSVIMARVARQRETYRAAPALRFSHAAVLIAAPGETQCGDVWSVAQRNAVLSVLVADGLGHGPQAEEAALAARAVFEATPFRSCVRMPQCEPRGVQRR